MTHFRFIFLFCLFVAMASGPVFAELYRWVDENGRTHFSDKPPAQDENNGKVNSLQRENTDMSGEGLYERTFPWNETGVTARTVAAQTLQDKGYKDYKLDDFVKLFVGQYIEKQVLTAQSSDGGKKLEIAVSMACNKAGTEGRVVNVELREID